MKARIARNEIQKKHKVKSENEKKQSSEVKEKVKRKKI